MEKTIKPQMNQGLDQTTSTKKSGLMDKVGEAVENIGNKVSDLGAPSVGRAIHDAGDRIEQTHTDKKADRTSGQLDRDDM